VTPNNYASVTVVIVAMIPSTVPAAIMPVKLNARTRIITGIVTVAAYVDAEAFSVNYRWCSDSDERG
jgi:hypothetical protein